MTRATPPLPVPQNQNNAQAEIAATKETLRGMIRARRRELSPQYLQNAAQSIAENFARHVRLASPHIIAGYWPMRFEADPRILMQNLWQAGHRLCLPEVVAPQSPLIFRAWQPGDAIIKGNGGMTELGTASADAPPITPNFILVPLIGFDRQGGRLGQGGGYYDQTLAKLRHANPSLRAIAIALAVQEIDLVPRNAHDMKIDGVVTESFFLDFTLS